MKTLMRARSSGRATSKALVGALAVLLLCVGNAFGDSIVYQSATMGPIGPVEQIGGLSIAKDQFLGSSFELTQTFDVTAVGGDLFGTGSTIFAAIVELSGPDALPEGSPGSLTPLAETVFTVPLLSADGFPETNSDFSTPLSVTLGPGDYALIFGTDLFGATGGAYMSEDNTDTPAGVGSYFQAAGGNPRTETVPQEWEDNASLDNLRFVVYGDAEQSTAPTAPEPSSLLLMASGLAGVGSLRRKTAPRKGNQ